MCLIILLKLPQYDGSQGHQCNTIKKFAPLRKILKSKSTKTTSTINFHSLPYSRRGMKERLLVSLLWGWRHMWQSTFQPECLLSRRDLFLLVRHRKQKNLCEGCFFYVLFSPKDKGETASLSFVSSFGSQGQWLVDQSLFSSLCK